MSYGSFSLVVHCVPIPELEDDPAFSELLGGKVDATLTGAAVSRENVDELGFAGCPYSLGVLTQCPKTVSNATLWAVE